MVKLFGEGGTDRPVLFRLEGGRLGLLSRERRIHLCCWQRQSPEPLKRNEFASGFACLIWHNWKTSRHTQRRELPLPLAACAGTARYRRRPALGVSGPRSRCSGLGRSRPLGAPPGPSCAGFFSLTVLLLFKSTELRFARFHQVVVLRFYIFRIKKKKKKVSVL